MRILFVLDSVENPTSANVTLALRLAGALARQGHSVHLLHLWDGQTPPASLPGCPDRRLAFADERMMNAALASGTAKLPSIELVVPPTVIGRTTVSNIQSGILYGYMGSVEKIVNEIKRELGCPKARVIATGGMAHLVKANSSVIDEIDPNLTLNGLRLIYEKNEG